MANNLETARAIVELYEEYETYTKNKGQYLHHGGAYVDYPISFEGFIEWLRTK